MIVHGRRGKERTNPSAQVSPVGVVSHSQRLAPIESTGQQEGKDGECKQAQELGQG